jgi:hypothetical protein
MEKDRRHVLTFHHGHLPRERLLAAMKAKNPRLMVLLTDCCSAGVMGQSLVPTYKAHALPAGAVMEWNTVASLFLRHSGLVDITAAEPGFCGKLDRHKSGSLFTNAFIQVLKTPYADLVRHLDRDNDGQMQWDEILPQLRGLAAQFDQQQNDGDVQQAFATSLGIWMPFTPAVAAN